MPTVPVYNINGEIVEQFQLSDAVFGVAPKSAVIASVVEALRANLRHSTAHTKSRGEVRGGGKKPWKQKGTGRARVGSIRSPLWRGGGIIFGPKATRNYTKKVNARVRTSALKMCLSDKVLSGALTVVNTFDVGNAKTKAAARVLNTLSASTTLPLTKKSSLLLLEHGNDIGRRITKNLPTITPVEANELNALTLMSHQYLVATLGGIQELQAQLESKKKAL